MNDDSILFPIFVLSILFAIFVGLLMLIVWPFQSYSCHSKWDRSGLAVEFGPIEGCMVKSQNGWIPADNYHNGNIIVNP